MPGWEWGVRSRRELRECDPRLQRIMDLALVHAPIDIKILEGHRSITDQLKYFEMNLTRVRSSKHNKRPSLAVDIAPYPIDWKDWKRFYLLAGVVFAVAKRLEIPIRWGGNWDRDADLNDQEWYDLVHFELTED